MAKYRKKPVVIEAVQYFNRMRAEDKLPEGVVIVPWGPSDQPVVHTLGGDMRVLDTDWIVTSVKGERYPVRADIFAATYEAVEGESCRGPR
jgi:hypothetical protein